jgi:hypothetical protein
MHAINYENSFRLSLPLGGPTALLAAFVTTKNDCSVTTDCFRLSLPCGVHFRNYTSNSLKLISMVIIVRVILYGSLTDIRNVSV